MTATGWQSKHTSHRAAFSHSRLSSLFAASQQTQDLITRAVDPSTQTPIVD